MSRHDPFFNFQREFRKALLWLALCFSLATAFVLLSGCTSLRRVKTDTDISENHTETATQQDSAKVTQQTERIDVTEVFSSGSSTSDSFTLSDKGVSEQEIHDHIEMYFDSIGNLNKVVADLRNRVSMQKDFSAARLTDIRTLEDRLTDIAIERSQLHAELNHYIALHAEDSLRLAERQQPIFTESDHFFRRVGKLATFLFLVFILGFGAFVFVQAWHEFRG